MKLHDLEKMSQVKVVKATAIKNPMSETPDGEIETNYPGYRCTHWQFSHCIGRYPDDENMWCANCYTDAYSKPWWADVEVEVTEQELNGDVPPEKSGNEDEEVISEDEYAVMLMEQVRDFLKYVANPILCTMQPPDRNEALGKAKDLDDLIIDFKARINDAEEEEEDEEDEDLEESAIEFDVSKLDDLDLGDNTVTPREAQLLLSIVDNLNL